MGSEYFGFFWRGLFQILIYRVARTDLERENLLLLRENQILKRKKKRVSGLTALDRRFYLTFVKGPRNLLSRAVVIRPETVLGWHRELVKGIWRRNHPRPGRPPVTTELRDLVVRMKRANPRWGALRITAEINKEGIKICKASVQKILRENGFDPKNSKKIGLSWKGFMQSHGRRMLACDYFTVQTLWLKTLYVFFIIDVQSKEIIHAGVTAHPSSEWLKNRLKSLLAFRGEELESSVLIADHDPSFKGWLKPFLSEGYGIELRQTPPRRPVFNCYAERMVRTFQEELTDRVFVFDERDLNRLIAEYVDYYNGRRAHSSIGFRAPRQAKRPEVRINGESKIAAIERRILDGLIVDFELAA
jgi:putative transposase